MRLLPVVLFCIAWCVAVGGCKRYTGAVSVSAATTSAAWTTAETPASFSFAVRNDHTDIALGVSVRIAIEVLSGGSPLTDADIVVATPPTGVTGSNGSWIISVLQPGESVTFSPSVAGMEPGTYRWTVIADAGNAIPEHNEADNVAQTLATVTAAPVAGSVNIAVGAPADIQPYTDHITMSVPITVSGTTGARVHLVRLDATTSGGTTFFYVPTALTVSTTPTAHIITVTMPTGGTGTITITADPSNYIPETDSVDNVRVINFPVVGSS